MPLSLLRDITVTTVLKTVTEQTTVQVKFSTDQQTSTDATAFTQNITDWTDLQNVTGGMSTKETTTMSHQEALEKGLISWDDATWILTSAFIIFTMQSGFGLLEAGSVSAKNEVNIMVKNAMDVVFGGLAYWMFGYGLSFGEGKYNNVIVGWGDFFVDSKADDTDMGLIYSNFIFQLSFATTATTIVSGAMAERTKLSAYIVFSFLNTVVYCVPAHWVWTSKGFLNQLGCVDIAGSGAVHLVGAVSALVATLLLKPRIGRYEKNEQEPAMGNATNVLVGMFMLWWGWLGFNCGSTFGISYGKWKLAAKSSVTTIAGSIGGGVFGTAFSYWWRNKIFDIKDISNSILGSLVSITAGCAVIHPWEAIVIGATGSLVCILATDLLNKLKIDDPVGAVAVHGFCGMWGLLSVGLFVEEESVMFLHNGQKGLFKGGGFYSLGIQSLAIVCIMLWSAVSSFTILMTVKLITGLRLSAYEEIMGSDLIEHGIDRNLGNYEHCSNCCGNHHNNQQNRSSFGFTRPTNKPVSPMSLLHVTTELNGRRGSLTGYVNKGMMELPTVAEGLQMFHNGIRERNAHTGP